MKQILADNANKNLPTIGVFDVIDYVTKLFRQTSGPKTIKATEIKAYLYAWCGQRKLKPEYEITPKGMAPSAIFACRVRCLNFCQKLHKLAWHCVKGVWCHSTARTNNNFNWFQASH